MEKYVLGIIIGILVIVVIVLMGQLFLLRHSIEEIAQDLEEKMISDTIH
jgi:sensor domain CHASE-containing protein